eukprot:CAMPEP_0117426088 /NCGR_PEP_ID=MMETSP0758-20121206/6255_1 /TAXON_ID=63605 /ORGANISM="Percolomonas cosmopolitus, Strain AE-1 (ATCC 50343)" /LENGTH=241 /DNA_ID=CAMNT_0005211013 /DNA_START=155 /DNA_END=880 /DNA_ORIENTATION=-
MKLFKENPDRHIEGWSKEFLEGYMNIIKHKYTGKPVNAQIVWDEYKKLLHHILFDATKWEHFTDFLQELALKVNVKRDEKEGAWMIHYTDEQAKDDTEHWKNQKESKQGLKTDEEIEQRRIRDRKAQYKMLDEAIRKTREKAMVDQHREPTTFQIIRKRPREENKKTKGEKAKTTALQKGMHIVVMHPTLEKGIYYQQQAKILKISHMSTKKTRVLVEIIPPSAQQGDQLSLKLKYIKQLG